VDLLTSNWATLIAYAVDRGPVTPAFAPVRISVGSPRWVPWAKHVPTVRELCPYGLLSKKNPLPPGEFDGRYAERLDRAGVELIRERLEAICELYPQPLVLLCWEPPGERCHRRQFAAWWQDQTGQAVPEATGLDSESIAASLRS
jgi:hypothetical protein